MIDSTCDIEGLDDLAQQLSRLVNEAAGKKQVRAALMAGSLPMLKKIRNRAPKAGQSYYRYYRGSARQRAAGNAQASRKAVQPGGLRKAIARKRLKTASGVAVGIYIKPKGFYWRFFEYGTPRMAAVPFIRNSFDEDAPIAVATFKSRLRDNIEKIKARQALAQAENGESE